MEHKIFSEYDRVQVENIFPAHRRRMADLDPDGEAESPRSWLPRRALVVSVFAIVLTILAAVLCPETLNAILHRNRDISQMGVPIGVPESSATESAPNENVSAPISNGNTANNMPAVARDDQPHPSFTGIARNNQDSALEPSTQGSGNSTTAATDSASEQLAAAQNANAGAENSQRAVAAKSGTMETKAARRPIAPAIKHQSTAIPSRDRVVRAEPYKYDDRMPRLHPGSVRARVVGTTPDGNLIIALPSGETAIVEPSRRRMRPMPIERRERFAPPFQPFDPTFPPVD